MSEDALRTIEAFLMCARHNHLPVQFNLFAFLPENLGGQNAYLDPVAWQAQARYVSSIARRFHAVPFLAWDLINEPSANSNLWKNCSRPAIRLSRRRGASGWRRVIPIRRRCSMHGPSHLSASDGICNSSRRPRLLRWRRRIPFAFPDAGALGLDAVRSGYNPLKVYDYFLFTQAIFADWVKRTRDVIRAQGRKQLITVGQEENGVAQRLSPAFYSQLVDFTADHTWWDFDGMLWASLAAKFPGKPMLIQETGEQRRLMQDDHLRLSAEEEGWQLERKIAMAFAQGAGRFEWVWNVNSYMSNDNEIPIGAVRPDGTEKPEAGVLQRLRRVRREKSRELHAYPAAAVTMVTSQALQYSGMNSVAIDTQKRALRALAYYDHTPFRIVAENRLAELGRQGS